MESLPPSPTAPAGVYVHVPFCAVRCTYCDFPTVAGRDDMTEPYLVALEREISLFQRDVPREVDSIYVGGGTPSRLRPDQMARLLEVVHRQFRVADDAEVSVEANPESLTAQRVAGYRAAGVTRLTIGVQSLDDRVLASVGRAHDASRARQAVELAREAGVPHVGIDLIAGLPGEALDRWPASLERAAAWGADHASVYLLETDKDTPLARGVRHGRIRVEDDDAMARAYAATVQALEQHGFELYEISNFARPGGRSRHNLKYWTDAPYAGFGVGAHGYASGRRRGNRRDLDGYLGDLAAGRDPLAEEDAWDRDRRLAEALVLGLRLRDGVDLDLLGARYGVDLLARHAAAWERAADGGLLVREGGRVRLTADGRLRSNELFAELI